MNAKLLGQKGRATFVGSDCENLFGGQSRIAVPFAIGDGAMLNSILPVSPRIAPIEIVRYIIQRIAVSMANHRSIIRGWPNKCFRHEAVHKFSLDRSISANRNLRPAVAFDGLGQNSQRPSAAIWDYALDTPQRGSGIVRGARDWFPIFHSPRVA